MAINILQQINAVLPQTQCQKCGFEGCEPYAEALVNGQAEINLCTTGREEVVVDLAYLLNLPYKAPEKSTNHTVFIEEDVCIGCTACIKVCPVDAIIGSNKLMHTVIADECTGCQLCIPACPVDCMILLPESSSYLPRKPILSKHSQLRFAAAEHAKLRYQSHLTRQKNKVPVKAKATVENKLDKSQTATLSNIQHMLAAAKSRAQERAKQGRVSITNQEVENKLIQVAQERAAYRHAQQKMRYGNEQEKEEALVFLREYKKTHEKKPKNSTLS